MAGSELHGKRELRRRQQRLRTGIGVQVADLRRESGATQRALAQAAGTDQAHVSRIERGLVGASVDLLVVISAALGADLGVRLFPAAMPRIRDHLQAAMIEALIRRLDRRWIATPELPVPAARGVIDLAIRLRGRDLAIACEAHSQLRSIDLVLRRLHEKTLALSQAPGFGTEASSVLLLRSTAATRNLVRLHGAMLAAAFPGRCEAAIAALAGRAEPWPGATLLWTSVERGRAQLLARPPRGVSVGR
jgi:transcriptional regulator with XRE-family HTH domain